MAKLTAAARKALPKADFGLPAVKGKGGKNEAGKGGFPMPDAAHAKNALARASQAVNAGRMSTATEAKIDAKADKVLGKSKSKGKVK